MHVLILAPFEASCLERLRACMKVTYRPWTAPASSRTPRSWPRK